MTVLIGSSLTGIPQSRTRIAEPIRAADVRVTLQDQAHVYEKIRGLAATQAGTSAATVNTPHAHADGGNLIVRHFASWQYGTAGPNGDTNVEINGAVTYAAPFRIVEQTTTTPDDDVHIMHPLIYVPARWVAKDIGLFLEVDADPSSRVTVFDDTGTPVTGMEDIPIKAAADLSGQMQLMALDYSDSTWGCVFQVSAAGLYYLRVTTNLRARAFTRRFYGGTIVGVVDMVSMRPDGIPPPPVADADPVQVGDPDASNAWQPIDDVFAPSAGDAPLHAALLTKMAENNALMHERLFGLPTPGNETSTLTGHAHTGAAGDGAEIGGAHIAGVCGGVVRRRDVDVYFGQRRYPPTSQSNTLTPVAYGRAYLPNSVNTAASGGTQSKIKFACVVDIDPGKGSTMQVEVTLDSATKIFESTTGGAGTEVLKTPTAGDNAFAYNANAINDFFVDMRRTAASDLNTKVELLSFLWYVEG
jgi:hypothetical protein